MLFSFKKYAKMCCFWQNIQFQQKKFLFCLIFKNIKKHFSSHLFVLFFIYLFMEQMRHKLHNSVTIFKVICLNTLKHSF